MPLPQSEVQTVGEDDRIIRLDTPTMQLRVATYPQELKEPVLWLAAYVREECSRDMDVLVTEAKSLKIEFDKTTWTKILRGRLQKNASGDDLPSPIVNVGKLLKAIASLREQCDLRDMAGRVPFVLTPSAQMMCDFIDKKRSPDRVNKFGMIVGHTGTQKTATLKYYQRLHNHGLGSVIEAPANGSLTVFVTDLAEKYGCSRHAAQSRKENTIYRSINAKNYIIVENVQRLYHERDQANQRVFNFLQKLQDDTGCTIILTLTPVFVNKLKRSIAEGYFEQFIGRAGGERDILTLEEFPGEDDVLAIAKSFALVDAEKHIGELNKMVREPGRVRVLFEALQEAKVQCHKKPLTITAVRAARGED